MDTGTDTGLKTVIQVAMEETNNQIDLSFDYHAHILPGCDHGSDSVATSCSQLAMAKAAGIQTVCATPHFYPNRETVENFLERRAESADRLKGELLSDGPRVHLGAEVLICEGMDRMEPLRSLCREGTDELLLEMPFYRWSTSVWRTILALHERSDIHIVLAHADRYDASDIERLIREGVTLQLNVSCFNNRLHRRRYLSWIDSGAVHYLGSDIHMLGSGYRDWDKCKKLLLKRWR